MAYSPGDRVELVRGVDGVPAGQRGEVTSTGFLGGLDIELSTGARLVGVDPLAVKASAPTPASADTGCAVVGLAGLASALVAVAVTWARARWLA